MRAGGPAGNTALALRALDVRHRVISNIGNDMFGQWLADTFGETSHGWQRVSSPTSISIGIEHPGGERSFLTAAGNLAEQTAADILGMLPARAAPGDIALLTGAFLYPALLDSFDMVLDLIGKRGFAVALDTGWPPDGWDASTLTRAAVMAVALRPRAAQRNRMLLAVGHGYDRSRCPLDDRPRQARRGRGHEARRAGRSAWVGGEAFHVPAPVSKWSTRPARAMLSTPAISAPGWPATSLEAALEDGVELASTAIASSPREYRQPSGRRAQGIFGRR